MRTGPLIAPIIVGSVTYISGLAGAHAQTANPDPCSVMAQRIDSILAEKQKEHDDCMAAHINSPHGPETPNQCSVPACQEYHVWVFGDAGQRLRAQYHQELNACRGQIQQDENQISQAQQITSAYSQPTSDSNLGSTTTDVATMNTIDALAGKADQMSGTDASGLDSTNREPNSSDSPRYVDQAFQQAADNVIDQGVDQIPGGREIQLDASNLQAYRQVRDGDSEQQIDGTGQIAHNFNDQFNTNPISKKVTDFSLNIIKVYEIRMSRTIDLIQNSVSNCLASVDKTDGCNFSEQFDKIWAQPVVQPDSSAFDN